MNLIDVLSGEKKARHKKYTSSDSMYVKFKNRRN